MNYYILIFNSTHKVLKAEQLLLSAKVKLDIIPTPKEITSDCGMSIRILVSLHKRSEFAEILENNNIEFSVYEK
ncbi:MAG TPA: DUF3343 domain-containing protein [Bacteroidales bacterium]|nr:DUF3343 domain-containing protein [Bacteroidales bacterium]